MCRSSNISPKSFIQYNIGAAFDDNFTIPKEPDITELGMIIAHLPLEPQLARFRCFVLEFDFSFFVNI